MHRTVLLPRCTAAERLHHIDVVSKSEHAAAACHDRRLSTPPCLAPRASPVTGQRWQLTPSSLRLSQVVRREHAVALPFIGSTSSLEDPWAHRILTFPHPWVNSVAAAFVTKSSSSVRLLSTSFFLEGLRGIAHLADLSLLVAGQPRGSTPRRRPPLSWTHRQDLGSDLLLLSSTHVELQRRRVELMCHVEELLLFFPDQAPPPNVAAPPLLTADRLRQEMV
jgi:hypothetical protein